MTDDNIPGWVAPGAPPPVPPPGPPPGPPPPPGWYPPPPQAPQGYGYQVPQFQHWHKPGIVALRPLGLGDVLDGAFNAIRRNPKPMVGLSAAVVTAFLFIPSVVSLAMAYAGELEMPRLMDSTEAVDPGTIITLVGSLISTLAVIILTGMLVYVVMQAVLGRKATVEETWRAVRRRVLPLLGLSLVSLFAMLLVGAALIAAVYLAYVVGGTVLAVLGGLAAFACFLAFLAFFQVRWISLAAPAIVVERLGVFAAMNRSWELTRKQFWRLLGIIVLTTLITQLVGGILGLPISLAGTIGAEFIDNRSTASIVYIFSSYLSIIVTSTVTTPFTAAVNALLYVDQRIRKEAYDVELIAQATGRPTQPEGA